jgi:hypothetical protein
VRIGKSLVQPRVEGTVLVAVAQCRRPTADRFKVGFASLPLAQGSVSRPDTGQRFGLRQPPDPNKEGTIR